MFPLGQTFGRKGGRSGWFVIVVDIDFGSRGCRGQLQLPVGRTQGNFQVGAAMRRDVKLSDLGLVKRGGYAIGVFSIFQQFRYGAAGDFGEYVVDVYLGIGRSERHCHILSAGIFLHDGRNLSRRQNHFIGAARLDGTRIVIVAQHAQLLMRDGNLAGFLRHIKPYLTRLLHGGHGTQHTTIEYKAGFGGNDFYEGGRLVVLVSLHGADRIGGQVGFEQAEILDRDVLCRQIGPHETEQQREYKYV